MKTVCDFIKKKQIQQKISMVTCYDYTSAKIIENSDVDCVLVGDSAAMVMLGADDTTHATLSEMVMFTKAVRKGLKSKFVTADMPFLSYRKTLSEAMNAVGALIQAGAQAVKLEGANGNLEFIQHIVQSGVPVMGHVGMTPQHVHAFGGFKVQGKTDSTHQAILAQAKKLEESGCFAIVLECVPQKLAQEITTLISIPTIGIGAGCDTDGQVLVFQDLLGLQTDFKPKLAKSYLNGAEVFLNGLNQYVHEVEEGSFPTKAHTYLETFVKKHSHATH